MKFIICSSRRCGSHMLATALDKHPQLQVAGEILVRPKRYGLDMDLEAPGQPGIAVAKCFEKYDGFINHRRHPYPEVWDALLQLPGEMAIISLKRRNILSSLVSEKMAWATEVWQVQQEPNALLDIQRDEWAFGDYEPTTTISLSVKEADTYIRDISKLYREIDDKICESRHLLFGVWYEHLVAEWRHWLNMLQICLGVEQLDLSPSTRKQETRQLCKIIQNYEKFKQKSRSKKWAHMLEE